MWLYFGTERYMSMVPLLPRQREGLLPGKVKVGPLCIPTTYVHRPLRILRFSTQAVLIVRTRRVVVRINTSTTTVVRQTVVGTMAVTAAVAAHLQQRQALYTRTCMCVIRPPPRNHGTSSKSPTLGIILYVYLVRIHISYLAYIYVKMYQRTSIQ